MDDPGPWLTAISARTAAEFRLTSGLRTLGIIDFPAFEKAKQTPNKHFYEPQSREDKKRSDLH